VLSGLVVTITAVHGLIAARLKRNFCLNATLSADHGMHLARASISVTAIITRSLGSSCRTASDAALGFIGVTFRGKELLIFDGKGEGFSAI
jgi:hypothetical protein